MPATYSPAAHPRLSAAAIALSPEALDVYAMEAESALGIAGTAYTGQDAEDLRLAVTRQVNRTLALESRGDGQGDIKQESKGDQSYTYSVGRDGSPPPMLDSIAVAIVERVTGGLTDEASVDYTPGSQAVQTNYTW